MRRSIRRATRRASSPTWLLAALALVAGCASTSRRLSFEPDPFEVEVRSPETEETRARIYLSVVGATRDPEVPLPPELRVALRLENEGPRPLVLESSGFRLLGSELELFGPPRFDPPPHAVDPGSAARHDVYFPYPEGLSFSAPDLQRLSLRWSVTDGERSFGSTASFERSREPRYDYYFYPPYGYGYPLGFGAVYYRGVGRYGRSCWR